MQFKCQHHELHATFLDLDDIYEYKLYDKRDNYPFFIACIPHLSCKAPGDLGVKYRLTTMINTEGVRLPPWE